MAEQDAETAKSDPGQQVGDKGSLSAGSQETSVGELPTALAKRKIVRLLLAVFCLAVALRVGLILRYQSYAHPNTFEFGPIVESLLEGRGFCSPTEWLREAWGPVASPPPFYAWFLAGCLAVFPADSAYLWIELIQVLLSAFIVVPVWLVARRVLGLPAAWLAAVLVAMDYFLACTPGFTNYTAMHVFLLSLIVWLGYRLLERPTVGRGAWFGAAVGAAMLNMGLPSAFATLLCLGFLAAGQSGRWRQRLAAVVVAGAVACLVIAPWTVRNWMVFHAIIPSASNFGFGFWMGNNPAATGGQYALDGRPMYDHFSEPLRRELRACNDAEQSAVFTAEAKRWIRENPRRWLTLRATSFGYFWTEQNFWLPDSFYEANLGQARPNPALIVLTFALLGVTLLGIVLTFDRWRALMPLYVLLLTYAVFYTLTHADITSRFRMPIEPWMLLLAAGGLARLGARVGIPGFATGPIQGAVRTDSGSP